MAVRFRWVKGDPVTMSRTVDVMADTLENVMVQGMQDLATDATSWMKGNAPWNDRTGRARRGLQAEYNGGGESHKIEFSHEAPYGKFLEGGTRYMAKRPIILPAIRVFAPKAAAVMRRAVKEALG